MVAIAGMAAAIRIGHAGERLIEMIVHHLLVRHARRHLPHPVHVVGKGDQAARPIHQLGQSVADHQRPGHFLEGAEVRQPARAVAGLEDDPAIPGPSG